MRRLIIGCSAAALSLVGVGASSTAVHATTEPPVPAPVDGHPVVGAWMLTADEFPDDPPTFPVFHADGTFEEAEADGSTGVGAWEATGATTFNLTLVQTAADEEGTFAPFSRIRASGEVSADGQTFTAEFTIEFLAEGFPDGEFGPGHVTGTRINVEPMGTPTGSFDDLEAMFPEESAPAGTEVGESVPADASVTTEAAAPVTTEAAAPVTTEAAPMTTEVVATTTG